MEVRKPLKPAMAPGFLSADLLQTAAKHQQQDCSE
jgi:hypothetical protein